MTRQAEFKRRVRARMAKTGESYAAARAQLLAARDPLGRERLAAALHVTNGDSAAAGLRATGLTRRILSWRDVLHEGPVPDVPDPELRRIRFGGLGELQPSQLEGLPASAATPLSPAALELAARAWAALRAPEPAGLGAIAAARSQELRFLGEAFDRLSREYPSIRDGLSLTERRVLAATGDGWSGAGAVFGRIGAREARPYLGDVFCWRIMARLVHARVPLLEADPPGAPVDAGTRLRVTPAGHRVLRGEADHVAQSGIDRWIGGVHLNGHHPRWRWDEGTESIV